MIKLPEPVPFMAFKGERVYSESQMRQAIKDALEEALRSYSPDDTATDYLDKIFELKESV